MIDSNPEERAASRAGGRLRSPAHKLRERHGAPSDAGAEGPSRGENELAGSGIEREFAERNAFETQLQQQADFWRDEVASRVEGYRTRRSKKTLAGEFSMKFDFGPHTGSAVAGGSAAVRSASFAADSAAADSAAVDSALAPSEPLPLEEAEPARFEAAGSPVGDAAAATLGTSAASDEAFAARDMARPGGAAAMEPAAEPRTPVAGGPGVSVRQARSSLPASAPVRPPKLIEFPRSLLFPEITEPAPADPYELAEPMLEKPRILDVPETVAVPAPPLAGLALEQEAQAEEEMAPPPAFELPLQVAPLYRRVVAALVDALLVLAGTVVFGLIAARGMGGVALGKPALALGLVVPVIFWSAYQYLFLVNAAQTPGMQLARLRVSTFEGEPARRMRRRWRALVLMLSCAALGFGFLWALFDEDNLCWHDKVTRTYLTTAR